MTRPITQLFASLQQARKARDSKSIRALTNALDDAAARAVKVVAANGGVGSVAYHLFASAFDQARDEVVPVAQRLADAGWPSGLPSR